MSLDEDRRLRHSPAAVTAPISSWARMRAIVLPDQIWRCLGGIGRRPWIEITETDLGSRGEPCLYAKNYLHGDLFAFNVVRRSEIRPTNPAGRRGVLPSRTGGRR